MHHTPCPECFSSAPTRTRPNAFGDVFTLQLASVSRVTKHGAALGIMENHESLPDRPPEHHVES